MAPINVRRPCIVCGKSAKDKKAKPLGDQDGFWKQHADEIQTDSKVPLKEFLKYFGISLDSVAAFAKAGDVNQVLDELIVCGDCNDWVLYGAFLKEKYLWVDGVLKEKIRNAFIHSRFQSRIKSDIGAVAERIRQCLMPCCVLVDKIAVPDETTDSTPNSGCSAIHEFLQESPPAKRPRTRASAEEVSGSVEVTARSAAEENLNDFDFDDGNSGVGDEGMDYYDPLDSTLAQDGTHGVEQINIEQSDLEDSMPVHEIISKNHKRANKVKKLATKRRPGPKSKTAGEEAVPSEPKPKTTKLVVFKECPVCQKHTPDYIKHMTLFHHVQPHHILLNNFWCRGCKMAYQPPDPKTPTGQYLHEHHDAFLEFLETHAYCPYSKIVEPHSCRFCEVVLRHKSRPAYECVQHEARFHADSFGTDYPLAVKAAEETKEQCKMKWRLYREKKRKKLYGCESPATEAKGSPRKSCENENEVVTESGQNCATSTQTKQKSNRIFVPIRKTCPICLTMEENYREHMTHHGISTHPVLLDFMYCRRCKKAYQPPDPDTPTGKYLPKDHECFLEFLKNHTLCSLVLDRDARPAHQCRYCKKYLSDTRKVPVSCMEHEIRIHADKVGECVNLIADSRTPKILKLFSALKTEPGYCPVCDLEVNAYGVHMVCEHNVLPHWIYTNYFVCRHCKLPYQPPDHQKPIGKYQPEDHSSFLDFLEAHSNCVKPSADQPPLKCRFCDKQFDSKSDPFCPITHQISKHGDLIGEDSSRLHRKAVLPVTGRIHSKGRGNPKANPESPVILLSGLKNEINEEDTFLEDPLMMDDFVDNFEDGNCSETVDSSTVLASPGITSPETLRSQEDVTQSETLGLEMDASGVRRSTRARKPIFKSGPSASSGEDNDDPDGDESQSDEDPSIVDLASSESEESGPDLEDEDHESGAVIDKKKVSRAKRGRKSLAMKLPVVSDDDEEEPDDGSEKVPCVLCDAQRSQSKLSKHYAIKHNLVTPHEGYFACKCCRYAFLSPDETVPTGRLVPEDIEYLKEFVNDHDSCKNKPISKRREITQLHCCRYCFKRYQGRAAMEDCIAHEMRNHKNERVDADSKPEVHSVFVFYCVYCKFKTGIIEDIYLHMRSHKKPHRFGCCKCDSQFKDVRELTYHIRLHGTSSEEVFDSCLLCDAYMDALSIVGHYRQNHGLEMVNYKYFGCWHCEEAFLPEQLERPSGTVFGDDLEHLANFAVRHESCKLSRQHPAKEQKCRKCPNTFTTMRQLVEHEETKHFDRLFVSDQSCVTCGRNFLSDEGIQKHSVLHLPEEYGFKGDVPFLDCPDCWQSFYIYDTVGFDSHILQHKPDKDETEKRFWDVARWQFYQNRNRTPNQPSVTTCFICESLPDSKRVMKTHYSRGHNITEYRNQMFCAGCKEIFVNNEGTPYQMNNATEVAVEQFKQFAANHKKCPEVAEKPIKCAQCDATLNKVTAYLDHCVTHRADRGLADRGRANPFPQLHCLRCGEAFSSILQLRDHLKGKVQAWKCRGCKQQFMTKESYAKHNCSTGTIDPEPEFTSDPPPYLTFRTGGFNCLTCIKAFDSLTEFSLHFKHHHSNSEAEVKFECSVCHEVRESGAGLGSEYFPRICADHEAKCKVRAIKEGSKTCEDFSWPDLTCFLCQETFDSVQRYSSHINEHFGTSADVFCPVCPAVFRDHDELRKHVLLHGLQTPKQYISFYTCSQRGCIWLSEKPEAESGRLLPEDLSGFQVFAESHEYCTRPQVTSFICKFCDHKNANSSRLFHHEIQHTKNWQVYCEECGRGCTTQKKLICHMRAHQEKLKYNCNLCPYKNRQRSELEEHMNTHTGARPFICYQCGKGFALKRRLGEHVQGVHNKPKEKTSPCTWGCDRMFATRREARVHELKFHNRPLETRQRNQHRDYGE